MTTNESLLMLLRDFSCAEDSATDGVLDSIEEAANIVLPDDYRAFMDRANGGEGFIGNEYLILWKAEELVKFNSEYEVAKYAPGLFLFASNGGGEGFAFDTRVMPYQIVQVPFIGMSLKHATHVADSYSELLERMHSSDGSLL